MPSQAELKLERLIARKENLFKRVQLCYEAGEELKRNRENPAKLENFKIRYGTIAQTILDYRDIIQQIVIVNQEIKPDHKPNYGILDAFADLCDHIEYTANQFVNNTNPPGRNNSNDRPRIHMPKFELVKFNGDDLTLWPLFHENFKQLIHSKPEFSKAEKLQYLLGSLTGKALRTCNAVAAIPDNYDIIWKLLEETYHDKKFLSSLYLDRLLSFKSVPNNNSGNLQTFLEKFDTNIIALKRLDLENLGDYILTYIAMSKLSQETINAFELIRTSQDLPTYDELIKFVRQQSKVIVREEKPRINQWKANFSHNSTKITKTFHANAGSNVEKNCIFCHRHIHFLKDCQSFKDSSHELKFKLVKEKNLCLNCFSSKHRVVSCPSKFSCQICKARHHTLLHRNDSDNNRNNSSLNYSANSTPGTSQENHTHSATPENNLSLCAKINTNVNKQQVVLLSTAIVTVLDKWNREQNVRFLIDSGSMSNLLSIECCKKLGFSYSKLTSNIIGIGGAKKPVIGRTSLTIRSIVNSNIKYPIEVLLVENVTNSLPDVAIDTNSFNHYRNLPLADPNFHTPGAIDGILGASVFAEIAGSHHVTGSVGTPTAIQTAHGYIVFCPAPPKENKQTFRTFLCLDSLVEKMFELENYASPTPTSEDAICENIFVETVDRNSDGRYTVALPFKDDPSKLGNSYFLAEKRLFSLEKRLDKCPGKMYGSIIQDYLDQGHMTLVSKEIIDIPSYYIPHHCLFKPDSISTPCRIVFDASMKTENGISLNDVLYTGPKLQSNAVTVLLNFRLHAIAMTSDVRQMYRQINILKTQRPFQRILWRFNQDEPILTYELNTVSFGVKSSPFLSLRTVKQLAVDESQLYPQAIVYVNRDMYMDDLICSLPDPQEAFTVHSQLIKLFQSGGFQMVKWMSNSAELLTKIPDTLKLTQPIEFDKGSFKVLGLQWNPSTDKFSFKIDFSVTPCTKRNMLSLVARTFDPLGMLAPITLFIKLLIKKSWELHLAWDQLAPKEIENLWNKVQHEFNLLNSLEIPRHLLIFKNSSLTIVGFADASPSGYAAVSYARTVDTSGQVNVTFLCAQSKVTPMSKVTLPRLELCAAALLAKIIAHIRDTYSSRQKIDEIFAFSDSTITLNWIHSSPSKWKTFISNRVSKIQSFLPSSHWYFVAGKQNVADCASRGLTPLSLINNIFWFSGPSWLRLHASEWPIKSFDESIGQFTEEESLVHVVSKRIDSPLYTLIDCFSHFTKLLNATVYVLRFAKILPLNNHIRKSDLDKAELAIIRVVQQRHFSEEYKIISENQILRSNLRRLNPFIKDGIIRVGGRLSNSTIISFEQKYPILLPKADPFVNLLIDYNHKKYCHTGAHLLQSLLRQNFWILSARNIIRQRVWKCNHCFKLNPKPNYPKMADLPYERVIQAKAFLSTGVDFTGAFFITLGRRRGAKSQKAYVCLFICLATKAIHLELTSDLSTECFLAAFKRFLSRRGNCATLFSDCGTNFVGAKSKLDDLYQLTQSREYKNALQHELNIHKINWKFNPPSSPHFGGIWEANIKSVKSHLAKVIGSQILTYEELSTVLTQIEALLNSRPLCNFGNDPNDSVALTPAHFLYGTPLNSFPAEDVSIEPPKLLNRYKLLDAMVQHFWKRWHLEYLSTLQVRQKWNLPVNPAQVGKLVVIMQNNIPPLQWPLALIEKLYFGKDGVARVATIRTKNSSYLRPVVKLCPLPNQ